MTTSGVIKHGHFFATELIFQATESGTSIKDVFFFCNLFTIDLVNYNDLTVLPHYNHS